MLIIADDLTGALDTGVQFSKKGIRVKTICHPGDVDLISQKTFPVVVINSDSRHCTPEEAYRRVKAICQKGDAEGYDYFYKKTDSALRGNIGAELSAAMDGINASRACFVPAFPDAGRVTRGGIHSWNGVPIHQTAFGSDRLNPVVTSNVAELIHLQTDRKTLVHELEPESSDDGQNADAVKPEDSLREEDAGSGRPGGGAQAEGIHIYDAVTNQDLRKIAAGIDTSAFRIMAGCAGFAGFLPDFLKLETGYTGNCAEYKGMLVLSGSIHPVSIGQIDYAKKKGMPECRIEAKLRLSREPVGALPGKETISQWEEALKKAPFALILDSLDAKEGETAEYAAKQGMEPGQIHQVISRNMADIAAAFLEKLDKKPLLFVIGGDTLAAVIKRLGCREIIPMKELDEGTVYSEGVCEGGSVLPLITKSGGFGGEDTIWKIGKLPGNL